MKGYTTKSGGFEAYHIQDGENIKGRKKIGKRARRRLAERGLTADQERERKAHNARQAERHP